MHKRLVEAIEIAGFYFHFIGEDSPDDGVSPLSSWQGPGHLFSIFPLHIDFSIDNQLDLVRPTWIEWPVCPSIFFVKFWRSSKSNGRWNSCVFSSNSSLILPPPFFLLYLGGISLPSSLYALFTGVCIWPGVCLFLFLFFSLLCHKNVQWNYYAPFQEAKDKERRKERYFLFSEALTIARPSSPDGELWRFQTTSL